MPVFVFRALHVTGRDERGVIDADSPRGAWETLRGRGLYPTALATAPHHSTSRSRRIPSAEVTAVLRQLATLVQAGVPVAEALDAAAEGGTAPALRDLLITVRARVREGAPLADALAAAPRAFAPVTRALVRAAEATATLPQVLGRIAADAEYTASLRQRIRAACTYPAVLLATTIAVLVFLLVAVVPQIADLFAETGTPLPWVTRTLLATVTLLTRTWWLGVAGAVAGITVGRRWYATPGGRAQFDRLLLRVPVVGPLIRASATARLVRTLATLLASGVPLDTGLRLAADAAGNTTLADAAGIAAEAVRRGESLAAALARTDAFSPLLLRIAATGERSGTLAAALERAADAAHDDVATALVAATTLLEPILVLIVGAAVLLVVLAVLVPVLTLQPPGAS